ncbi:hypothetical protein DJ55_4040 [Yersinia pseudotuberculosis]|nr:hypothetical protein DJ55_4040 [Yersinia pseudotuberculosis]
MGRKAVLLYHLPHPLLGTITYSERPCLSVVQFHKL